MLRCRVAFGARWKLEDLREELRRVERRVSQQVEDDEEEVEKRGQSE